MRHCSSPADRIDWICRLLRGEGMYGGVTEMSRWTGVSRQTLTCWRTQGRQALSAVVSPPRPTSPAPAPDVARAILTLLVNGHASYRGIQHCLAELLGSTVSLGTISGVVREAGRRAQAWLATLTPPQACALAVDELFGHDHQHAYLSAVDATTGVVWATVGPLAPDTESWTLLLWEMAAHGVTWNRLVHDGGAAVGAACAAVAPAGVPGRDVWHVLARCRAVLPRLERAVAAARQRLDRVARYEAAVAAGQRPRQRPPTTTAAAHAEVVAHLARTATDLRYLTGEIGELLQVVLLVGERLRPAAARRADLEAAVALLAEVGATAPAAVQRDVDGLHTHLREALPGLLVWAEALDPVQQDLTAVLGDAGVALVGWAWRHRDVLGPTPAELLAGLPPGWHPAARVLLAAWDGAVRASSLVETWHSLLRPHLAVHRTLPVGLLAVLAAWHNHRVVPRGVHAGSSPLQRSGLVDSPTDWLSALGYPPPTTITALPVRPVKPGREEVAA